MQIRPDGAEDGRYRVADDNSKSHHAAERESPLGDADGDQSGFPEAVLDGALEAAGAAELAVDDDEADRPVDDDRQADEQHDARDEAGVLEGVRLSDDPRADDAVRHVHERRPQARLGPRALAFGPRVDVVRPPHRPIRPPGSSASRNSNESRDDAASPESRVAFAVGAGVLTTCNYVARKFGCRSGMAGFVAKKLCPELLLIRPNFEKYTAKAHEVRDILADYDPRFESASIDEAYLNITEYCAQHSMTAEEAVQQMRAEIHEKTKITVSAGIAANAKLAKICSNFNKPNGQYSLPNDRNAIMSFMRDLPTRKVNGIGRVLERELQEIGIRTCGDIYSHRQFLRQLFGEKAYHFLLGCHLGLGRTQVQPAEEYERKSVGTESTFRDISDPTELRDKLQWTAGELEKDMRKAECKGRTLVLKVKLHTYEVFTRQIVVPKAVYQAEDLYQYSLPILTKLQNEIPHMKLRLMGLRCTNLVSTKKPDTRAFFGLQSLKVEGETSHRSGKRKADELASRDTEHENDSLLDAEADSGGNDDETLINSVQAGDALEMVSDTVSDTEVVEQLWDCPICARPQPADERRFNDHLDSCLSRQAIRDTVQRDTTESPPLPLETPTTKRIKSSGEKKRGRPAGLDDPKQKKLSFG
ncbi:hypothetical protein NUW58_g7499 [Xylaria curta]|uniref:Uncharacterized protein n=1 Tax=Xylaria curta TaxID=42375 RepID=A0ACC1NGM4_9PEZI|nr:hypothetical protein NUW58_g7499 [Xylaria curta]